MCVVFSQNVLAEESKPSTTINAEIERKVDDFIKTGSPVPIESLIDSDSNINRSNVPGDQAIRLRLKLLEAALTREKKGADQTNSQQATMKVLSRDGKHVNDPSTIKDPVERAEYEERLRRNNEQAKNVNEQASIQHLKSNVLFYLRGCTKHHEKVPEAKHARDQILEFLKTSTLSPEAKAEVMEAIRQPATSQK
jgi:hypothetical protein